MPSVGTWPSGTNQGEVGPVSAFIDAVFRAYSWWCRTRASTCRRVEESHAIGRLERGEIE